MYHRFKWTRVSQRRNQISKEYEPLQPYYLLELSRTVGARTFVDVGANIGLYSIFQSQSVDKIVAYEANESLVQEINSNFRLNDIKGSVRQFAVSDRSGSVTFGIVSRYAGNSAVIDQRSQNENYARLSDVKSVRLDDDLISLDGPIAFKIDVEGHEASVLEGSKSVLSQNQCIVQIENFDGKVDKFFSILNYQKLSSLGPDSYYTNISGIDPLSIYERSATALIEANHENKSIILTIGDLGLVISGRLYQFVRSTALVLLRGKL